MQKHSHCDVAGKRAFQPEFSDEKDFADKDKGTWDVRNFIMNVSQPTQTELVNYGTIKRKKRSQRF